MSARLGTGCALEARGSAGVPRIIRTCGRPGALVLTRLPGRPLDEVEDIPNQFFANLRVLVNSILQRGVAGRQGVGRLGRTGDGQGGLGDFERVALRRRRWDARWFAAPLLARLALLELIHQRAPHLLTRVETIICAITALALRALRAPRGHVSRAIRRHALALFETPR